MKKKLLSFASSTTTSVIVVFVLCLILITYNLITTYRLMPFTSDDVFWQVILLNHWRPFSGSAVTLGNASVYVDKIPFYQLLNHFFKAGSRRELFAESAIQAWIGFTAFYFGAIYFLKKCKAKLNYLNLLPFVWFSSFGYVFISLYLNPDWRGFQIGFSFGVFALIAAILAGDIKTKSILSKVLIVLLSLFAGLQTYSDPYFLYFTIIPVILLLIILILIKSVKLARLMPVLIVTVITLISAKIFAVISAHAGIGIAQNYPMQFVNVQSLPGNTLGAFQSILQIFSANFFGLNVVSKATVVAVLNFIALVFATYIVISTINKARRVGIKGLNFHKLWLTFFAILSVLVFLAFTISTLAQGIATYRYFLMLVLLFVLILSIELGTTKSRLVRNALIVVLLAASVLNLAQTEFGHKTTIDQEVGSNKANTLNYSIIKAVEVRGYTKGYANYWQANINTYLSGDKVDFLPSVCPVNKTEKFLWLINDSAFYKPASKSFYLVDPDYTSPPTCTVRQIEAQYGQPAQTEMIDDNTILFYNYDITSKTPNFVF